jgi:TonB family protein
VNCLSFGRFSPQRRRERGVDIADNSCGAMLDVDAKVSFVVVKKENNSAKTPATPRLRGKRTLNALLTFGMLAACAAPPEEPIEPPQVLTDSVPFVYPLELWDHNISGQTVLLLLVNATGQVDSVTIDSPSGYAEFDSAAVQGAHRLRFIAARQGDRRIPMWTKVPVRFSRDTTKLGIGGT